jgi:multimeric flavodoxin WrbA
MTATNPKKILVLQGSPRKKGNSNLLSNQIAEGAQNAGAAVETIYLHGLEIAPCQACEGCQKPDAEGCVIKDDMQTLYPKIADADALVLASPVYWFTMSAQLKLCLDRFYAFGADDYRALSGKKVAVAMSYGDADPFGSGCVNALRSFQDITRFVGSEIVGMVYGTADKAGEIQENTELMTNARELGTQLAK